MPSLTEVTKQMARKLKSDMVAFGRIRDAGKPKTFPHFRDIRDRYRDLLGLIFSIEEKYPYVKDEMPPNMPQWLVRQKLNALAMFTDVSYVFIKDPPLALTSSLGAFELLQSEHAAFTKALETFDTMMMEAAVDDKMADELDATHTKIEEILGMVDKMMVNSPKILQEF